MIGSSSDDDGDDNEGDDDEDGAEMVVERVEEGFGCLTTFSGVRGARTLEIDDGVMETAADLSRCSDAVRFDLKGVEVGVLFDLPASTTTDIYNSSFPPPSPPIPSTSSAANAASGRLRGCSSPSPSSSELVDSFVRSRLGLFAHRLDDVLGVGRGSKFGESRSPYPYCSASRLGIDSLDADRKDSFRLNELLSLVRLPTVSVHVLAPASSSGSSGALCRMLQLFGLAREMLLRKRPSPRIAPAMLLGLDPVAS